MYRFIIFSLFIYQTVAQDDPPKKKVVVLEQGRVVGEKYWNGDFYEFYGIPFATAPTGKDRFKGPLPPPKWDDVFVADNKKNLCHQTYNTEEKTNSIYLVGEEQCLTINLLVPEVASKENLVPVLVYIHSGGFAAGSGIMAKFNYLARHDIIVISFNFRLGAQGFACLGNKVIPGNAGMKDQVAALRWINKNIKEFGGDPNKVTLAGFSVGAAMAELLSISKPAQGLIDKLILESGSALAPYAINRDPIATAVNLARSMGYNGTTTYELTKFYLKSHPDLLASRSINFYLTNSTFGYTPCIENDSNDEEPFLTEDPLEILKKGDYKKIPVLAGFGNMEGLSRVAMFDEWSVQMNKKFDDFLPANLKFSNDQTRREFIKEVKQFYFDNKKVSEDTAQGYVDYFSDSMFKYSIMKSAHMHAASSKFPVYLFEFSYFGTALSTQHRFIKTIKGAGHRDQTAYILDFYAFTNDIKDLTIRDRLTWMWSDFVKYGDPTAYESQLVTYKWKKFTEKDKNYLSINIETEMKKDLNKDGYQLWDEVYDKYYWKPEAPKAANDTHI